jgi:CBS domain-containing protein
MTETKETGYKLSQKAPTMPTKGEELKRETYGVAQPVSSVTIPSVYNKKLNKLFRGRLVVLPGDFTAQEALRRLAKFNISAVPVLRSWTDKTIIGFAGVLDFLAYLIKLLRKEDGELDLDKENLKSKADLFRKTPIRDLVDQSGRDPFKVMHGEESLADAVEDYLKGVQRIAITDDNGDVVGVISQWTVANYLATVPTEDKEWIPVLREPVSKAKFTTEVVCINRNESALQAFNRMYQNKISAIAIVDDDGKLIGNLSASDLKGYQLYLDDFNDLLQPVWKFLGIVRKMQGRPDDFVVAFTPDILVKEIVKKFNEEIVHRAYIVDENRTLIGVFSLTDLMQQLVVDTHTISTFAGIKAMTLEEKYSGKAEKESQAPRAATSD